MAANRQTASKAPSPLATVALVPLGGFELPPAITRALSLLEAAVVVKPGLEELLDSALVVFAGRDVLVADAIATLRGSRGALKPVLALIDSAPSPWIDASWRCIADEAMAADASPAVIAAAVERLGRIAATVAKLPGEELARTDAERRRLRALRWMATRDLATLAPERAPGAKSLHRYGGLEAICGAQLDEDLTALVKAGHLQSEHADRVYRCACGDARLHLRDACEHCRASNLEIAHVLRHRCGHTASSADFWRGEELACPACGDELKVAGQDYEGPVDRTRCIACSKLSKDGLTIATCLGCGETAAAEKLVAATIARFVLTESGRAAMLAAPGEAPSDAAARRAALQAAWKRLTSAPVIAGRPRPPASLVRYTGSTGSTADLDGVLRAALRSSDVAVRVGANSFVALLPDTTREGAERFAERIAAADATLAPAVQIFVHPEQTGEIEAALSALVN